MATVTTERVFNFSPGPAVLPLEVLEQAQSELLALPGVGSSILEISHRSPAFDRILEDTLAGLLRLVPEYVGTMRAGDRRPGRASL